MQHPVRSNDIHVQELCALLELAGPIERAGMDSKQAIELIIQYEKLLKSNPKSWAMPQPDAKTRSQDYWALVVPVMPYDLKGVYHNENALVVVQSTDSVPFIKAMASIIIAHSQDMPLGVPSQLARYGMIWDSIISKVNGESGGKSMGDVAHSSDTFVFKQFLEAKRTVIAKEDEAMWFPFVLYASYSLKGEVDPDKIITFLEQQWKGMKWSKEMIKACSLRLPTFT